MRPEIGRVVELIQRKDEESHAEAPQLLQNTEFSFSMKVCGQRQDAEDTMQEVLLQSVPTLFEIRQPQGADGLVVQSSQEPLSDEPPKK